MGTPFTPLLDPGKYDDPSFINTPAAIAVAKPQKQVMNPVIPKEFATLEDQLKAEGSSTSTLGTILAWVGAAKGDFRGLQAIEESKRRTSLAKSMIPNITKVNDMVNSGKWEEASKYVDELASSYGTRADYLVPYFQQMQASIQKKQEGWKNLKFVANAYKDLPEGHPSYSIAKVLREAAERRDLPSETTLNAFMTRNTPHIQNIDRSVMITDPLSGKTSIQQLPAIVKGSDIDNFAGNTVATANAINIKQLSDVMNDLPVENNKGVVIKPGSELARNIKTAYVNLQPANQEIEQAKLLPYEPAVLQQIAAKYGRLAAVTRAIPSEELDKAIVASTERDVVKDRRLTEQRLGLLPIKPDEGAVVHLDASNPDTFLTERTQSTTRAEVDQSGGKLAIIPPNTMGMVRKTQSAIQGLDTAAQMIKEGATPQTRGDKIAQGLLQKFSTLPYIGYPIGDKTEARQLIKTIINTAIEQMENTAVAATGKIDGRDRADIEYLKTFATGDFKSEKEITDAIAVARARLTQNMKMAIGVAPPVIQPETPRRGKTPAAAIAPLIPSKGGQVTRSVYDREGRINLPPDFDPELTERIARTALASQKGGSAQGGTVNIPVGGTPQVVTPTVPTTPEAEKAAIKARLDARVQQKAAMQQAARQPDIGPSRATMPPQVIPPYQPNITPQQLSPLQPLQSGDVTEESEQQRVMREIAVIRAKELADRGAVPQQQSAAQPDRYQAVRDMIYRAAQAEAARKKKVR